MSAEGYDMPWEAGVGHGPAFGTEAATASFEKILGEGGQIDMKSFGKALFEFGKYNLETKQYDPIPEDQKEILSRAFENALENCEDGADVFRILTAAGFKGVASNDFLNRPEIRQKVLTILFAEMDREPQFLQKNFDQKNLEVILGYIGIDKVFMSSPEFLKKVKETAMRWIKQNKWSFISPIVVSVFEGDIDEDFLAVLEENYKNTPVEAPDLGRTHSHMGDFPVSGTSRADRRRNLVEVFGDKIVDRLNDWDRELTNHE